MKSRTLEILAGLCALVILPLAARAGEEPQGKKIERRVIVAPGQEPRVMVWEGAPGELGPGGPGQMAFKMALMGRGFLGVQLTELTPELRKHFGVSEENGVMVGHVEADSPADRAGMRVGDILMRVDDEAVEGSWDVTRLVRPKKDGETVNVEVVRDGRSQQLSVTLAERERREIDMAPLLWKTEGEPGQEFEMEVMGPAMKALKLLDSPEMKERMDRVKVRNLELEKKLEEMEQRLRELEKKLDKSSK
jgi:membrane-associated protease RseP (regulator of RpoE activity)